MNESMTPREVSKAIKNSELGKVSGPDWLLELYCNCFEDKLLQTLQSMKNSILHG